MKKKNRTHFKGAAPATVAGNVQQTQPSRPLRSSTPRSELGDSGTRGLRGIITEEYNSQLQGIEGIKIYDEMRKSDGTCRAAILACTLPIRGAKWFVNPANDTPEAIEQANFVEHALFDWLEDMTWDDVIRQALLSVPLGVMLFEKVYGVKEHEGKTYVTLTKLAPRLPKSILMWELTDGTFGIQQIRQDGILAQIPGSKLLIFVNEREGNNWWGTSMLRAAYKHWYYKNNFYKIDAIAFERQGMGIPVISMPVGYTENDEKRAVTTMENMRANENAYLVKPPGYEFEFANMGSQTTRDPEKSINHHNKEILISVLAQFLELGQSSNGGSKALSSDHSELFLKAMESVANSLAAVFNKNLVPELIDMNFNDVSVYPVVDFSGITKADVAALGEAFSKLVAAGALTPTEDDEQYLRAALGLPPRTQEDIEEATDGNPTSADQLDHANIDTTAKVEKETEIEKPTPTETKKDTKTIDAATAKKKAHDHTHDTPALKFSDGMGFTSWRPMTFAEKKIDWTKTETAMNDLEAGFTIEAKELIKQAKDKFMTKIHAAMDAGDAKAVAEAEIKFEAEYKALLKKTMKSAYEYGKTNASTEMGIERPANTADTLTQIDLLADTIANKTASDISAKAKLLSANHLVQDTPTLQAVGAIDEVLDAAIDDSLRHTTGLIISQSMNGGRNDVFQRNSAMIYGLQRSELLDKNTCDFCLSMDGLVVEPTDQWARTDIFHENCRGIWVEIMKDEQDVESIDITGVPAKIGDYYGGTPNSLIQPPKPITQPGSLADDFVKQREADKKAAK